MDNYGRLSDEHYRDWESANYNYYKAHEQDRISPVWTNDIDNKVRRNTKDIMDLAHKVVALGEMLTKSNEELIELTDENKRLKTIIHDAGMSDVEMNWDL